MLTDAARESCAKETEDMIASGLDFTYASSYAASSTSSRQSRLAVPEADTCAVTARFAAAQDAADTKAALRLQEEYEVSAAAMAKAEAEDQAYAAKVDQELEDEALAAKLERDLAREVARERADDRLAQRKLERADSRCAAQLHRELDREDKALIAEAKSIASADEAMAMKMSRKMARQDHRDRKARQVADFKSSAEDDEACWAEARKHLELEDVDGAICISVRLPGLVHVSVKPSEGRFVYVDARRAAPLQEISRNHAKDKKTTTLQLKLEVVSKGCAITKADLQHDYDSASAYLHVYVENMKLQQLSKSEKQEAMSNLRKSLARSVSDKIRSGLRMVVDSHTK